MAHFYVSGYSNSVGSLSVASFDMFVLRCYVNSGLVQWGKRFGFDKNDKANGIFQSSGFLYVVGESDSTGWTSSKTDMIFLKMASDTSLVTYGKRLGGSGEDKAIKVIADTDTYVYSLGDGFSVEYTYGTSDIFLMR